VRQRTFSRAASRKPRGFADAGIMEREDASSDLIKYLFRLLFRYLAPMSLAARKFHFAIIVGEGAPCQIGLSSS
jgi:hypothetical protein